MDNKTFLEMKDSLYEVISKLSFVRDFMQTLDSDSTLSKYTPNGLGIILTDCVSVLCDIGGFNEQVE